MQEQSLPHSRIKMGENSTAPFYTLQHFQYQYACVCARISVFQQEQQREEQEETRICQRHFAYASSGAEKAFGIFVCFLVFPFVAPVAICSSCIPRMRMCVRVCVCVRACVPTYIHTYIHSYLYLSIHPSIHTYILTFINTYTYIIRTCIPTHFFI